MARFRRSFRSAGRNPRGVTWCGAGPFNVTLGTLTGAATNGQQILCGASELAIYTDPTIMRVRGNITAAMIPSGSGSEGVLRYAFALLVADKDFTGWDALDSVEIHRDVLWYHFGILSSTSRVRQYWNGSAAIGYQVWDNDPFGKHVISLDSKAMRKVKGEEDLKLYYSVEEVTGDVGFNWQGMFRTLIKE